jgi:MshEN domain
MKVRRGASKLYRQPDGATQVLVGPRHSGRLLGEILVEHGAATPEEIEIARARQNSHGDRLGEILIEQGVCDEHTISAAIAEQYGLKVVDLRRFTPEHAAIDHLGGDVARTHRVLPLRLTRNGLIVVVDDVPSSDTLATLATHLGGNVGIVLAPPSELTRSLETCYRAPDNMS